MSKAVSVLSIRGVGKQYGQFTALHPLTLDVAAGEWLAVIGANGAGKSTLMQIIAGVTPPSVGSVNLNGKNITHAPTHQRVQWGMGLVAQRNQGFIGLTVADNLRCALLAKTTWAARGFFYRRGQIELQNQLEHLLHTFGLDPWREQRVASLPHGTQRLLELAMTLAGNPTVVVLDEPCTGLNPAEVRQFIALLKSQCAGKTVLLVEHDVSVVFALAQRIAVLDQGHLIACGPPESIKANPAVQAAYLGGVSVSGIQV